MEAKFLVHDLLFAISNPDTPSKERRSAEASLESLGQFTVQHARDLCEIASTPDIPSTSKLFITIPVRPYKGVRGNPLKRVHHQETL